MEPQEPAPSLKNAPSDAPQPAPATRSIRTEIERFFHFDKSPVRHDLVARFLAGDPIDGLTRRPAGEGVNGAPGPSGPAKQLAQLFAGFYAYVYKGGYGPLTLPDVEALVGALRPCIFATVARDHAEAFIGGVFAPDYSDVPEIEAQFRDLLLQRASEAGDPKAGRVYLGRSLKPEDFRATRDRDLDRRRGIGVVKRAPGRPPEPEDVRKAKEAARAQKKTLARAERMEAAARRLRESAGGAAA